MPIDGTVNRIVSFLFLCSFFVSSYFVFSLLYSPPLYLSYHSLLHISMRNEVAEGDVCFTKNSEDVLSCRGVKKSSEETRFAQARGWARFTLALAKIV